MDAITMIKERRSIRNFKDKKVDRDIVNDIISIAIYSPSWANSQTARYTVIDTKEILQRIINEGYSGFEHNTRIAANAAGVIVISNVKGKCGCTPDGNYATSKGSAWEMFDAGVASQTLCLAAYEKGIGTVIQGIFDEKKISEIIGLPEDETVAAVIPYGYETDHPKATPREPVEEVVRYL